MSMRGDEVDVAALHSLVDSGSARFPMTRARECAACDSPACAEMIFYFYFFQLSIVKSERGGGKRPLLTRDRSSKQLTALLFLYAKRRGRFRIWRALPVDHGYTPKQSTERPSVCMRGAERELESGERGVMSGCSAQF